MYSDTIVQEPRNTFELIKWFFFEPILFERYSDALKKNSHKNQNSRNLLKDYMSRILFIVFIWFSYESLLALFDLSNLFNSEFSRWIFDRWNGLFTWKYIFLSLLKERTLNLFIGLAQGTFFGWIGGLLAFGVLIKFRDLFKHLTIGLIGVIVFCLISSGSILALICGLSYGLATVIVVSFVIDLVDKKIIAPGVAIAIGFIGGLVVSLVGALAIGLVIGIVSSLVSSLVSGLVSGFVVGIIFGLVVWLVGGLVRDSGGGLVGGLVLMGIVVLGNESAASLVFGLAIFIGWKISYLFFYLRFLTFYPIYCLISLFHTNSKLDNNPYRRDGAISFPIPKLKSKLICQSYLEPEKALDFIDFLVEYRPLQKTLVSHLYHSAIAGLWIKYHFNTDILKSKPIISADWPKFEPSDEWFQLLEKVREERVSYESQSSISFKLDYYERYLKCLKEFEEINFKKESALWNHYYFDAFKQWMQQAEEEHERLRLEARIQEPIARNVYRAGDSLNPEYDKNIFIGREVIKEELQNKILSSPQMPLFLIHGQRRVGKTSLLKFLPDILGPRFKVVYMDLQPLRSIYEWFVDLKKLFDKTIDIEKEPESAPLFQGIENDWLVMWKTLQHYMEKAAQDKEYKIILAFDEYEKVHYLFQKAPDAAENLLSAMRSFSQHQNKIIFLFVGAALFPELKNPSWSNYFVQASLLRVDYLKKDETFKLINVAGLDYPNDVLEKIFELTQGHPTLVQRICQEMVTIANMNNRKSMTMNDLNEILNKHVYRPQNGVCEVFWGQFCESEEMKTTVKQVIHRDTPSDKKALFRLLEHGFVIEKNGQLSMRVPIFETWVNQFGDVI